MAYVRYRNRPHRPQYTSQINRGRLSEVIVKEGSVPVSSLEVRIGGKWMPMASAFANGFLKLVREEFRFEEVKRKT